MAFHIQIQLTGKIERKGLCHISGKLLSGEIADGLIGRVQIEGKEIHLKIVNVGMVNTPKLKAELVTFTILDPGFDVKLLEGRDFVA